MIQHNITRGTRTKPQTTINPRSGREHKWEGIHTTTGQRTFTWTDDDRYGCGCGGTEIPMHYHGLTYLYVRDWQAAPGTESYLYYIFERDIFIAADQAPWHKA